MGLRIFSLGSLVLDTMSVGQLLIRGIGSDAPTTGVLVAAGALLPLAAYVGQQLLRRWERPTAETIRHMEGFVANYF